MRTHCLVVASVATILAASGSFSVAAEKMYDLQLLAQHHLPRCHLRADAAGKVEALVSATGEVLELATAARDHPQPSNSIVGYWFTPTMDFLSRQKPSVTTPEEAVGVVQLLHALWRGPVFVGQKLYSARAFAGGWVVQVEHDFKNDRAMVAGILPYELLVGGAGTLVQLRQRCYPYPGSAVVYTNTIIGVCEREIKRNRGQDYPEVLFKALRAAWEKEKEQKPATPRNTGVRNDESEDAASPSGKTGLKP